MKKTIFKYGLVLFLAVFAVTITDSAYLLLSPGKSSFSIAEADSNKSQKSQKSQKSEKSQKSQKSGDDGFMYNLGNGSPYVSDPIDCTGLKKLQIIYHKDFKSTEDASGPNILVTGSDSNQCTVTIEKVTGGNKCGFKLTKAGNKIKIQTKPKGNKKNCEMCIKVVAPRTAHIIG